jgi:hypothetical protein
MLCWRSFGHKDRVPAPPTLAAGIYGMNFDAMELRWALAIRSPLS